jgi:hypothetical protein
VDSRKLLHFSQKKKEISIFDLTDIELATEIELEDYMTAFTLDDLPYPFFEDGTFTNFTMISDVDVFFCGERVSETKETEEFKPSDWEMDEFAVPHAFKFNMPSYELMRLPDMSTRRMYHSVVYKNHRAFVFGGNADFLDVLASAEAFNVRTNSWESLPNLP